MQINVEKIINNLPDKLKSKDFGFIAGSWVAAEIFKQLNLPINPVANDIDWFVDFNEKFGTSKMFSEDSSNLFEGVNISGYKKNLTQTIDMNVRFFKTEYGELSWDTMSEYKVITSKRLDDEINVINIVFNPDGWRYTNSENDNDAMKLIRNFDINAIQVALDLSDRTLHATPQFWYFCRSQQLEIVAAHTPAHSIIRYLKKKKELGCYGDDVFNARLVGSALTVENFASTGDVRIFGKITKNKADQVINELNSLGFFLEPFKLGTTDIELFRLVSKNLPIYDSLYGVFGGDLKIENVSIKHSVVSKYIAVQYNNEESYRIPGLTPRNIWEVANLMWRGSKTDKQYMADLYEHISTTQNNKNKAVKFSTAAGRPEFFIGQTQKNKNGLKSFNNVMRESTNFVISLRMVGEKADNAILLENFLKAVEKEYGKVGIGVIENDSKFYAEYTPTLEELQTKNFARQFEFIENRFNEHQGELTDLLFEECKEGDVEAKHINTHLGLLEEGVIQKHCVGGYSHRVKNNACQIVSTWKKGEPRITFELIELNSELIEYSGVRWYIGQARIRFNGSPTDEWLQESVAVLENKIGKIVSYREYREIYNKFHQIEGNQVKPRTDAVFPELNIDEEDIPF